MTRSKTAALIALAIGMASATDSAMAYNLFDGHPKWGDLTPGTGAVITWSLIPDGTGVVSPPDTPSFIFSDFWSGTSNLSSIYTQLNADPAVGETLFMTALNNAFATWSEAADLTFVQVPDAGLPLGHTGPTTGLVGDIRIGAFGFLPPFDAFAGHSFEPPGGTSSLGVFLPTQDQGSTFGDLTLNTFAFFSSFPGLGEGDNFGGFPNDIEGLLLHEIGHTLGLGHPEGTLPGETDAIMYVGAGCCDNIQRTLGADDIAAIQYLYGPNTSTVPIPAAIWLFGSAVGAMAFNFKRRKA